MDGDPDPSATARSGAADIGSSVQSLVNVRSSAPRPLTGVVERPRLFALLDGAADGAVTSIAAPAGSGKTQLLASWAARSDRRVAWLTLDRMDGDPLKFWSGVLLALRRVVRPEPGSLLATLSPAPEGGYLPTVLPALVVDALAELEEPVVLVLDDVHAIDASPTVEGLSFLMLHLPASTRLIVSGTYLPQFPRGRLRLEGKLTTVPSSALMFTELEAQLMFEHAGIEVTPGMVAELTRRTEGWSAGLRLAALTGGEVGVDGDRRLLTETELEASEYLVVEVMRHLPEEVQYFLLHTCVCDRICGELGDALTGRSDGSAILRWLTDHNVFTVGAIDGGDWYRYHSMFTAMLRRQVDTLGNPLTQDLHRRASVWLAEAGLVLHSFDHAARGMAWERAGQTLLTFWLSMYLDGELVTLRDMLQRLPQQDGQGDREIADLRRVVALSLGEPDVGGQVDLDPDSGGVPGQVLAMERGRLRGDLAAVRSAAQGLQRIAEDPLCAIGVANDLRALAFYQLGVTEFWAGQRTSAEEHLRWGLAAARAEGRGYVELGIISHLVEVLTSQDRLDDALVTAGDGAELARKHGWEQTAVTAELWHALGWVHYLRDDLDEADRYLDLADDAVRESDTGIRVTIQLVRALVLSQRGFKRRALARLEEAAHAIKQLREPHLYIDYVEAEIARLLLTLGQVGATRQILSSKAEPGESVHLTIARAELLISDSRRGEAWELMRDAVQEGKGWLDQRIQAHVLLAVLQAEEQGMRAGLAVMAQAIELAAPERMVQPLLQFGPRVDRLLEVLERRQPRHRAFVTEVRTHIAASVTAAHRTRPAHSVLQEQLTSREIEVLARLDGMDTLPEIAAALFVTVNTVKTHLRSLYRKLGVHARREALSRAEELGLL